MSKQATIGLESVVAKSDNFVESSVDGEAILMHLDEGSFSSLKSTGLRIWELLDTPKAVSQICSDLMGEFDVEASVCEEQTLSFLDELNSRGLIQLS